MKRGPWLAVLACFLLCGCYFRPTPTPMPAPTATPARTVAPTSTPPPPTETATPTRTRRATPTVTLYVVQQGDVLGVIARRFGTTVEAILEANGMANPDLLSIGQMLLIPPAPTPTPSPTP